MTDTKHKTVRDIVHEQHTEPTRWDADTKHTDSVEAIILEASNRLARFEHEPAKWHNMMVYEASDLEGFLDWLRTVLKAQASKKISDLDYDAVQQFEKTNPRTVVQDGFIYYRQLDVSNFLTTLQAHTSQQVENWHKESFDRGLELGQQQVEEAVRTETERCARIVSDKIIDLRDSDGNKFDCYEQVLKALTPNHQD